MDAQIPVELWRHIIRKLHKRDWRILSLTSRALSLIAREILYEEVEFWKRDTHSDSNPKATLFARTISERPELGRLVRTLRLFSSGGLDPWSMHPVLCRLTAFTRLQHLSLLGLCFDADFCNRLSLLGNLRSVRLTECTTDSTVSREPPQGVPENGGFELFLVLPLSAMGWTSIAPLGLRTLSVDESEVGRAGAQFKSTENILVDFTRQKSVLGQSLTRLEWNRAVVSAELIHFLEAFTQIRSLSLRHPHQFPSDHVKTLSPAALPLLEEFSGAAAYAETFVRGRPVHTVALGLSCNTSVDVLDSLKLSGVPVTTLEIYTYTEDKRFSMDNLETFLQHAPTSLQHFSWDRELKRGGYAINWKNVLARMPALHGFNTNGQGEYYDASMRQEIMKAASEAEHGLRELVFRGSTRAIRRDDGTWEEYLVQR